MPQYHRSSVTEQAVIKKEQNFRQPGGALSLALQGATGPFDQGSGPNACDLRGFTPLIIAAYNGQAETVDFGSARVLSQAAPSMPSVAII